MLGEKIRGLFRPPGEAPPVNGRAIYAPDLGSIPPAAHGPLMAETDRRSNGLRQFFEALHGQSRMQILDLGGASQANINFITLQGHRLYTEDLLLALDRLTAQTRESRAGRDVMAARFLADNLAFAPAEFDGIMVWDTLEFLEEEMLAATVGRLHSILKPGGTLLSFFHTHAKGETVPVYRYQIRDHQTLHLRPRVSRPLPRALNNRSLERLFANFHAVKFFLSKENLREVIVTR